MLRGIALWISLMLLAGCATQRQLDLEAHARCVSWGAKPKSDSYVTCRTAEESNQIQRRQGLGAIAGGVFQGIGAFWTLGLL
jgi:hypothetical protein